MIQYGPNPKRCKHPEILMDPEKAEFVTGDDPCHNFCACWDARISTCWINDDSDYEKLTLTCPTHGEVWAIALPGGYICDMCNHEYRSGRRTLDEVHSERDKEEEK